MSFQELQPKVIEVLSQNGLSRDEKLKNLCQLLSDTVDYYNWVGFYFANHEAKTLHLGPYVGAETDHTVIPFGKGICGQVAVSNQNFVVPDVQAQDNYIACSMTVKSEVVVPLFVNGANIGQIDIDPQRFTGNHGVDDGRGVQYVAPHFNGRLPFKLPVNFGFARPMHLFFQFQQVPATRQKAVDRLFVLAEIGHVVGKVPVVLG